MIYSASHLLALAHGRDCVGDLACFYCGAPADGTHSTADHVKDTFTAWSQASSPHSSCVCEGCVLSMIDTADVLYIDGVVKHMARAATRMNSWVITARQAVAANKSHVDRLRSLCLVPPDPPYAIVISESGQTHQIYRAKVGRSFSAVVVNLEGEPIVYRPDSLSRLLDVAGKLAACVGKPGLQRPFSVALAARVIERYSDAEALMDSWRLEGGSPLGRLASWLSPNMEDCKSAYPSDLD